MKATFSAVWQENHCSFLNLIAVAKFRGEPLSGTLSRRVGKLLFSTEIAFYVGNGMRYAHGQYGSQVAKLLT